MDDEKRMIQGYEVKTAIHIGGKEVILAENKADAQPYMACDCTWDNPFSTDEYHNAVVSEDYLEIMSEFLKRVGDEVQHITEQRAERGVSNVPLIADDCVENSHRANYANQLVVIRPEKMTPSARTADNQLVLATHGNGCDPDARGTAVFCTNVLTGKGARWERQDFAGIIRPDRTPHWALAKLTELQKPAEKKSVLNTLESAKKTVAQKNVLPKETKKDAPSL